MHHQLYVHLQLNEVTNATKRLCVCIDNIQLQIYIELMMHRGRFLCHDEWHWLTNATKSLCVCIDNIMLWSLSMRLLSLIIYLPTYLLWSHPASLLKAAPLYAQHQLEIMLFLARVLSLAGSHLLCRRPLHLKFTIPSCPQFPHRDYLSL